MIAVHDVGVVAGDFVEGVERWWTVVASRDETALPGQSLEGKIGVTVVSPAELFVEVVVG